MLYVALKNKSVLKVLERFFVRKDCMKFSNNAPDRCSGQLVIWRNAQSLRSFQMQIPSCLNSSYLNRKTFHFLSQMQIGRICTSYFEIICQYLEAQGPFTAHLITNSKQFSQKKDNQNERIQINA